MLELPYYTLDVFTDRIFGGNPLAVIADAPELATEVMQAIAREFNYSETVFVRPPTTADAHRRVRIFTPGRELPFAGHPTIGTALLLAELGIGSADEVVLEEGVGNVRVRITRESGRPVFAELTAARPAEFGTELPTAKAVASIIGLSAGDVDPAPDAIASASCGVPFLLVRVRDRQALARARVSVSAWEQHLKGTWATDILVYCVETGDSIRARMFAPGSAIPEDPATGGAAVALAGYLAARDPARDGIGSRTIVQGVEMGRPSTLHIKWEKAGGSIVALRVGGQAVRVAQGTMRVAT